MPRRLPSRACERCGRELRLGSTKYQLFLELSSAWDGYLPDAAEHEDAARLIEQAVELDEETLENQVHLEIAMIVCPQCRREILENLEGEGGGPVNVRRKSGTPLQ